MKAPKLNVQGLARTDQGLMSCMIADPGHTLISVDLSAGEPTVTSHYSKDPNYYDATFGMVGKQPYYDSTGLLKIDDIYLTAASISPLGAAEIRDAFSTTYGSTPAFEQWVNDSDVIKAGLKSTRALHKILVLGIGYAMGPKKMVQSAYNKGFIITLPEAKEFYKKYWDTFYKVRQLADSLSRLYEQQGYLVNEFGYRLKPDQSYKALNYFIQSTVSGVVNCLSVKFFTIFPEAQFVTVIHDEIILQVPDALVGKAQEAMQMAVGSLNSDLGWSTAIRTGWAPGKTLYEAH